MDGDSGSNSNSKGDANNHGGAPKQRTIQVKIGNQAAKSMTPDQAAEYLKTIAGKGAFAGGREVKMTFGSRGGVGVGFGAVGSGGKGGGSGDRETTTTTKMTFGPKRPPGSGGGGAGSHRDVGCASLSSLELAALAGATGDLAGAAAVAAGVHPGVSTTKGGSGSGGRGGSSRKDGMPCSEKEMKALMSMFVEIMGLQMNTEKLNKPRQNNKNKNKKSSSSSCSSSPSSAPFGKRPSADQLFHFPEDLPPPPGGWPEDLLWPPSSSDYRDDENSDGEDEDDSLPELEPVRDVDCLKNAKSQQQQTSNPSKTATSTAPAPPPPPRSGDGDAAAKSTGTSGIAAFEWEALERVAIEDALEQEERARKAAKKREKKNRKKEKARKEAELKATEEAAKKREKSIQSWRARVASATQSNEVGRLQQLLGESPLRKDADDFDATVKPHLEFLAPNALAKNRSTIDKAREAREKLASFILSLSLKVMLAPLRNGRSALHTACFHGDLGLLQQILDSANEADNKLNGNPTTNLSASASTLKDSGNDDECYLDATCQDSGWAPLHYAALSGSMQAMEVLLSSGCKFKTPTNDTHTWLVSNGKGLTARQLLEFVVAGNWEKEIETHGMALQDATSSTHMVSGGGSSEQQRRRFMSLLERISERLKDVESNGFTPLGSEKMTDDSGNMFGSGIGISRQDSYASDDTSAAGGAKKSKKKKKNKSGSQRTKPAPGSSSSNANGRPATAAEAASPSDSKSSPPSLPDDPLVTALLGMGFTGEQIASGIKSCGGINRATADEVVVWILGQQDEPGAVTSNEPDPSSWAETTDDIDTDQAVMGNSKANRESDAALAAEAKKHEAAIAAAAAKREEQLAAERLAAKREETRRRNREWNKSAQVRQWQEAQAKLARAAELKSRVNASRGQRPAAQSMGLVPPPPPPPSTMYFPPVTLPVASAVGKQQKNMSTNGMAAAAAASSAAASSAAAVVSHVSSSGALKPTAAAVLAPKPPSMPMPMPLQSTTSAPAPAPPTLAAAATAAARVVSSTESSVPPDVVITPTNDTSTVASYEHGSVVEIGGDDATVSTLGSIPPRVAPVASLPQQSMPPVPPAPVSVSSAPVGFAPPGFGMASSDSNTSNTLPGPAEALPQKQIEQQQHHHQPLQQQQQPLQRWEAPVNDRHSSAPSINFAAPSNLRQSVSAVLVGPPPGIPETGPSVASLGDLDHRARASSLTAVSLGGIQSRINAAQEAFGTHHTSFSNRGLSSSLLVGGSAAAHQGSSTSTGGTSNYQLGPNASAAGVGSSFFAPAQAAAPEPAPDMSFDRMLGVPAAAENATNNSPAAPPSLASSTVSGGTPSLPNPNPIGFGLEVASKSAGSQTLESSIIDSISTGNTTMLGASLWGDPHHHHPGIASATGGTGGGGGSLLGNLIHTNTFRNDHDRGHHSASAVLGSGGGAGGVADHNPDSLFAPASTTAGGNHSAAPGWGNQENSGGGSIW